VFDIGVGSGVLSAVCWRGVARAVVATDQDPRALACARDNLQRLGLASRVQLLQADLFPPGHRAGGVQSALVAGPPELARRAGGLRPPTAAC
jgi:methylase of polypeptide subunit release factors